MYPIGRWTSCWTCKHPDKQGQHCKRQCFEAKHTLFLSCSLSLTHRSNNETSEDSYFFPHVAYWVAHLADRCKWITHTLPPPSLIFSHQSPECVNSKWKRCAGQHVSQCSCFSIFYGNTYQEEMRTHVQPPAAREPQSQDGSEWQ